jgi:hypothetical protein
MSGIGLNPYDIFSLAVGPVRAVYAPTTVDVWGKLQDFVALVNDEGKYELVEEVEDFGTAPEGQGASYTRGFETQSLGVEASSGAVFTDITDVNRGFSLELAEVNPKNVSIVEGVTKDPETIAKAKGASAQTRVPLGSPTEFPSWRIALIGQRKKDSGIVKEPDGTERGRLVAIVLNRCTITADDAQATIQKGNLMALPVQFEAFPEPGLTGQDSYGGWLFEEAGTIEAAA